MTPELTKLTWVLVLHMLCWIPYLLNRTMVQGLVDAVGYPDNPNPLAARARAHSFCRCWVSPYRLST